MTERRASAMEPGNPPSPQRRVSVTSSDCRSYPEEALGLPYYHPTVTTMKEVRDIFVKYLSTSGFYLLRKSFTKSSTLTVSVVFSHSIKHFTISQKETGTYFLQGKLFSSIKELVIYYGRQEVPNKEEISGIFLKHPVLDLKRHHFFASSSKRHMSVDEGRTRTNSWKERGEGRTTSDRKEHLRHTSQSFSFKAAAAHRSECELGYEKFSARNDSTSSSGSSVTSPQRRSPDHHPFSGYLHLDRIHQSDDTDPRPSANRPMSQHADTGEDGRRTRSGLEHALSRDRTLSNQQPGLEHALSRDHTLSNQQQPTSPGSQTRSIRDRPQPQQQHDEGQRSVVPRSPILTPPPPPPPANAPHLRYCYARSPYTQLAPSLVQRLREIEGENAVKCQCGIYHDDAELPRGWSFHRSTEPETYGRVLFTGPEGQLDWNLPLEVSLDLSSDQQDKIRDLICRSSRPCSHLVNARGSGSVSATNLIVNSGCQTISEQQDT